MFRDLTGIERTIYVLVWITLNLLLSIAESWYAAGYRQGAEEQRLVNYTENDAS
jgi:hypothetical protein